MKSLTITVGGKEFDAQLDEGLAPNTVAVIARGLPMEGTTRTWGDEIYFSIPVNAELENGVETVSVGDLAYWPQGSAFCIFYGQTPMSPNEDEIVPASAVTPLGTIEEPEKLKEHASGEPITIEKSEGGPTQ
jgi:hypothetical protein